MVGQLPWERGNRRFLNADTTLARLEGRGSNRDASPLLRAELRGR
jgi:hypothetical protein